mmetsp:Transcript_37519/g.83511  ORF Transcript_37519/g.83511 Transcript_37519/m.83511 type:complete len:213 (-) Transcript_37519:867-1505(-)
MHRHHACTITLWSALLLVQLVTAYNAMPPLVKQVCIPPKTGGDSSKTCHASCALKPHNHMQRNKLIHKARMHPPFGVLAPPSTCSSPCQRQHRHCRPMLPLWCGHLPRVPHRPAHHHHHHLHHPFPPQWQVHTPAAAGAAPWPPVPSLPETAPAWPWHHRPEAPSHAHPGQHPQQPSTQFPGQTAQCPPAWPSVQSAPRNPQYPQCAVHPSL